MSSTRKKNRHFEREKEKIMLQKYFYNLKDIKAVRNTVSSPLMIKQLKSAMKIHRLQHILLVKKRKPGPL